MGAFLPHYEINPSQNKVCFVFICKQASLIFSEQDVTQMCLPNLLHCELKPSQNEICVALICKQRSFSPSQMLRRCACHSYFTMNFSLHRITFFYVYQQLILLFSGSDVILCRCACHSYFTMNSIIYRIRFVFFICKHN